MASIIIPVVVGLVALLIGLLVGYILRKSIGEKTIGNAETKAKNMLLDAEKNAESIKKAEGRLHRPQTGKHREKRRKHNKQREKN